MSGAVEIMSEIQEIDFMLYITVALRKNRTNFLDRHRRRCQIWRNIPSEAHWPFYNCTIPSMSDINESELRIAMCCMNAIEKAARNVSRLGRGTHTTLLGISAMIGGSTKLQYVLNRLGVVCSYDTLNGLRSPRFVCLLRRKCRQIKQVWCAYPRDEMSWN